MSPNLQKQVDLVNHNPDQPADAVFDAVHTVMHLYRSMQLRGLRDTPHAITHMEYKVLGFFTRHPGATQSELVSHSGRDKAQVARLIKGLRDQGLLDAEADANDRRSTRLRLSALGKSVIDSLDGMGAQVSALAVAGMSEQECAQLLSLLVRVRHNLEAHSGGHCAGDD